MVAQIFKSSMIQCHLNINLQWQVHLENYIKQQDCKFKFSCIMDLEIYVYKQPVVEFSTSPYW